MTVRHSLLPYLTHCLALRGGPVQYRECQGSESEQFLSLFPKFIAQDGGVDSGFKHVKPEEYRKRLLQIKSVKNRLVSSRHKLDAQVRENYCRLFAKWK